MSTCRHYFLSTDLDELELMEEDLEAAGVATPQIHALTEQDAQAEHHQHLHSVKSFMKTDVLHSMTVGALIGALLAAFLLLAANLLGWTQSTAGWLPFAFLAVTIVGFSAWEGGLVGIQRPNHHFARFRHVLKAGKHILFVDLEPAQEPLLASVRQRHPTVKPIGTEASHQHWLTVFQQRLMGLARNF